MPSMWLNEMHLFQCLDQIVKVINIAGAALTFVGSLLIAFSVSKNPGGIHQQMELGKKQTFAVIEEVKFKSGVWLIVIGFFFQLLGIILGG